MAIRRNWCSPEPAECRAIGGNSWQFMVIERRQISRTSAMSSIDDVTYAMGHWPYAIGYEPLAMRCRPWAIGDPEEGL